MRRKDSYIKCKLDDGIIEIYLIGDLDDDAYKQLWYDALYQAKVNSIYSFYIDQSRLGKVSFNARSWFLLDMVPLIKKELNNRIKGYIKPSEVSSHSVSLKFMINSVKVITKFKCIIVDSKEEAYIIHKKNELKS